MLYELNLKSEVLIHYKNQLPIAHEENTAAEVFYGPETGLRKIRAATVRSPRDVYHRRVEGFTGRGIEIPYHNVCIWLYILCTGKWIFNDIYEFINNAIEQQNSHLDCNELDIEEVESDELQINPSAIKKRKAADMSLIRKTNESPFNKVSTLEFISSIKF